jgi:hypothetical protein
VNVLSCFLNVKELQFYSFFTCNFDIMVQVCFGSGNREWFPLQKSAVSQLLGPVFFDEYLGVVPCKAFRMVIKLLLLCRNYILL